MQISDIGYKIIELRLQNTSLKKIRKILGCSSATISKYCSLIRENSDIIKNLKSKPDNIIGLADKQKEKAKNLLRNLRPNSPNWHNNYNIRLREASKQFLLSRVNYQCQICGYNKCHYALAFHHLDPLTKLFSISGQALTYSLQKLITEASKCIVLCHNCHSEVHHSNLDISKIKPIDFTDVDIPNNVIIWHFDKLPT